MASWGIAIQPLKSHILLHYSNSLFLYIDSNLSSQPISFHFPLFNTLIFTTFQNYLLCRPSPDHIAVYQFDTSSLTHPNLIGLWNISSQYKVSVACWASYDCGEESLSSNTSNNNNNNNNNNNDNTITSNISVALSLNSQGSTTATLSKTTPSVSSLTSTSNHSQQTDTLQDEPLKPQIKNSIYALLGTRNGTVLRLDISSPGTLTPLTVLPRSPTACTTPSTPATNFIISSPSQFTNSPTTTSSHSNHGTVSSIAAAPCGMGVYAIGYATGHISIVQLTSPTTETFFLRPIHEIPPMGSPRKILALSWHYSSKNFSSQSLAALRDGSDRLIVWTVDIFDNCKKIREVPLPQKHAPPSVCDNFLQWSKSGKIIRVSDSGLIISDVRTKKVVTRSVIFPALPVVCVMVRSNKGKAWAVNSQGKLQSFNLVDGGSLLESTQLPFNLKSPDTTAILDSPVVFLQNVKVGEITQVIITKSPRSSSHDDNNSNSKHEDEQQSRPDNASSSSCIPAASFNTAGPKAPQAPPIRLCMTPIKSALASLFPSVIKNLSKMPAQRVPEFNPSQLTVEQYVLCALFGGVFNTTLCLSGIRELLYSTIDMKSNCSLSPALKRAVILLLVQKPSQQELLSSLNQFEAPKELLASLLYAATVASTASNSIEEELLNQFKQALSLSSVSSGKQAASTPNKQHINYDQLHFTCAYLHSLGLSLIASQLYMSANFYLEALSICLLSSLDVVPVLRCWSAYLQKADSKSSRLKNNKGSNSSTNNLVTYLINIVANLDTGSSSINTNSDANSTHSVSSGFALSNDESEYIHATISGYYRPTSGISSSSLNNNNNSNSTFDSSLTTTTTANSAYEIFDIHPSLSSSSSSPSSTSYMSNMPTPNNFHTSSAASSPMAYNSSVFTTPNANVHGFTETSSHDITDVTSKTGNTNASDSISTVNICRSSSPKSTSSSHSKNFALSQQNTPDFSIEDNNNVMIFSPEFSSEDFSNQRSQNNGTMNSSTKNFFNSLQSSRKSNNINNNLQQTKPVANAQMVSPNMPPSSPPLSQNSISCINQESSVPLSPSSISKRSGIIVRQQQQQHLYQPTPNSPFNPPRTPIMSDEFPTGNHSITTTPNIIGTNSNGHYVEVSAPSNYPNFSRYVYSSPSGNVF